MIIILRLKKRKKKKTLSRGQAAPGAECTYIVPKSLAASAPAAAAVDHVITVARLPRRSYNNNNKNVCAQYDNFF